MAYRIQSRVGVKAPAHAVWAVIADLERWNAWNPLFVEAEGRLSIGALLTFRRARSDGTRGAQEQARLLDWVPNEQILWSRTLGPFARVIGFLEIEALSERACILSAGELYDGLIGQRLGAARRRPATAQFLGLCEAAKAQAEATWDGTPGEPPAPPSAPAPKTAKPRMQQMSMFGRRR